MCWGHSLAAVPGSCWAGQASARNIAADRQKEHRDKSHGTKQELSQEDRLCSTQSQANHNCTGKNILTAYDRDFIIKDSKNGVVLQFYKALENHNETNLYNEVFRLQTDFNQVPAT